MSVPGSSPYCAPLGPRHAPRWRWLELVSIFFVGPSLLALVMQGWMVFPAIWFLGAVAAIMLLRDPRFDRREFGGMRRLRPILGGIFARLAFAAVMLGLILTLYRPTLLLALPRERPLLWTVIMLAYPVLSVYPQEIAFRAFFRHRYGGLVRSPGAYLLLNATAFGYAHIVMHNTPAIILCFAGGLVLAWAYERHRSLAAAWLEHTLYGCAAFTIGWGPMLYGGGFG